MLRAPPSWESAEEHTPGSRRTPPLAAQIPACACGRNRAQQREARTSPPQSGSQFLATSAGRSGQVCCSCSLPSLASRLGLDLLQSMTCTRVEVKLVELLQFANLFKRRWAKRCFAVEGMQHNPFEHIAQRHVVIFSKSFEHFQDALLHTHTGLYSFNLKSRIIVHNVPKYQSTKIRTSRDGSMYTCGASITRRAPGVRCLIDSLARPKEHNNAKTVLVVPLSDSGGGVDGILFAVLG